MALLGDSTSFFIGRRLGRDFLRRNGPRFGIKDERLDQIDDYFARHGGKTIFIGRFVGFVRAFAPFIAGSSGMRYRAFVPYSILGTGLWVSSAIVLGYVFSRNIDSVINYAGKGAFALGALIVIVVGVIALRRHLRVEENRRAAVRWMEAHGATRWLVLLGRRFGPQLGFLWDRVTPGGTFGLEFTTLMAILAVSLFVLVAYTVIVSGEPGPTPGDTTAFEFVERIRVDWLVDMAKVVTALGSAAVVLPLAAVCAGVLAWRGRWAEVGVLVAGMALIVDRRARDQGRGRPAAPGRRPGRRLRLLVPQPPRRLLDLLRLACGDVVMRLRVGMARGAAVIVAGIALAALIGLSRVYLGVHYLSDVNAGWALGVAAFSLCAAVALVITTSGTCGTMGRMCCPWRCRRSKMSICCSASPG